MNYYIIPPLVSSLLFISLGIFVLFNKKRSIVNVAYFLSCLATFWWQFSWVFLFSTREPHLSTILVRLGYTGIVFIPITLYHFYMSFLDNETDKKWVGLAYLIGFLFTISIWSSNYFVQGYYEYFWGFYPRAGVLHPFYLVFLGIIDIRILYLLARHLLSNREKSSAIYSQTKYLFLGLLIYSFAATDFLVNYGVGFYPLGFIAILVTLSITAYAITKTHLMDISVIISKSIAYGITMAILAIAYLLLVAPYRMNISPNIDIGFISLTIAYGIFVGFAFERLRMFIQTSSDKVFLKGRYDFKRTMSYFVGKLFKVVSLEELKDVFDKARIEIVESKILKIVLLDSPDVREELSDETIDLLSNSRKIEFMSDIRNKIKDVEYIVPCFSGDSFIAVLLVGKKLSEDPFKDDEIDVFRILAPQIATVIERVRPYETAQKDLVAEQEKVKIAQKAAEENARLAALGTLAAGLAHEIRNPMTVIRSKSETVIEKIDDKDYVLKFAKLIPEQIDRILGIVNRMLKFARTAQEELIPCDTNKILQDTAALLDGKIKDKNLKLSYSLGAKSRIMANPVTLSEAVFNILLNAIDFTPCGGEISLSSADSDGKVVIEIKDNGEGIAADKIGQIFDPFFTTRAEGTGLGLSIAYRTIREHKGSITAASTPGAGALFTITLPSCQ